MKHSPFWYAVAALLSLCPLQLGAETPQVLPVQREVTVVKVIQDAHGEDRRFTEASQLQVGDELIFTAIFRNVGSADLSDLDLRFTLPSGVEWISVDGQTQPAPDRIAQTYPALEAYDLTAEDAPDLSPQVLSRTMRWQLPELPQQHLAVYTIRARVTESQERLESMPALALSQF